MVYDIYNLCHIPFIFSNEIKTVDNIKTSLVLANAHVWMTP